MLAVAYRNIVTPTTGSTEDASGIAGEECFKLDRRLRHRMQRSEARSLLCDLLASEGYPASMWQLIEKEDGKPTLVTSKGPSGIEASLSHSGSLTVAAITDLGAIGVDIENRSPARSISEIASYAFGPREKQAAESGGIAAFYRIWTLREALAKARGIGFLMLADGRDYFAAAPATGVWQSVIDGRHWVFATGELSRDYVYAVAITPYLRLKDDYSSDLTPRELS